MISSAHFEICPSLLTGVKNNINEKMLAYVMLAMSNSVIGPTLYSQANSYAGCKTIVCLLTGPQHQLLQLRCM